MEDNLAIVILAAGNSSRLGQSKQLLKTNSGISLLNRTINIALESDLGQVFVVLGADFHQHRQSIIEKNKLTVIHNRHWEKGMGSSLKLALNQILKIQPTTDIIIIMVCDQPYLTSENLKNLKSVFKKSSKPIIVSKYQNDSYGVPVLFNLSEFQNLQQISDEAGALNYVKSNLEKTEYAYFHEGNLDIDTPDDMSKYLQ